MLEVLDSPDNFVDYYRTPVYGIIILGEWKTRLNSCGS